jgi:phosphoesterase RecJ-like protein
VLSWLEEGRGFLLTTHVHPDADGLGSLAALAQALQEKGRRTVILLPTPMQENCRFLFEGCAGQIWQGEDVARADLEGVDRAVILDVSSLGRVGAVAALIEARRLPTLVLDHHLANDLAGLSAVFPGLSSTGEVVAALLAAWGVRPGPAMAQALYAALTTDTGGFAFSSTTGDTLELAAALVRAGARPERVHAELDQNHPPERYDLLALFLASRRSHAGGRLLEFALTREMLARSGATREDSDGFANLGLSIRGCQMCIVLCELDDGAAKVNLRCVAPRDAAAIALALGGGGHRYAAGATVRQEAGLREQVLALALAQFDDEAGPAGRVATA